MAHIDWSRALDLSRATGNVRSEFYGDWYRDPWGWPELDYVEQIEPGLVDQRLAASGVSRAALLDVPKENWGTRPAVVLDILDRIVYQALVDRLSFDLIGRMSPNVFGWRLHASNPSRGEYSHNNRQWDGYRNHLGSLGGWNTVALKTDITSCFASIPIDTVQEEIATRCSKGAVTDRLCNLLDGFSKIPERSGLPQRSLPSAIIANMVLTPLDDVLESYSRPLAKKLHSKVEYRTFARWMDDIWLFGNDPAAARRAQMDLQSAAQSLGLTLNSAKTLLLEGDDVAESALEVEHSAVDNALLVKDSRALDALIDKLIDQLENASRTSLKFGLSRMVDNGSQYRIQELLQVAERMPQGADALAVLFKKVFRQSGLQDWFLSYAASDWATHQWTVAQYAQMFPSSRKPKKAIRDYFSEAVRDANTGLPLLAVCSQRLAAWDPVEARAAFRDAAKRTSDPHARRVLALAALGAKETRPKIRSWLSVDPENAVTLKMLKATNFAVPKMQAVLFS